MQGRKRTEEIIIHCAATRPSQDIDAREIDRWHRQRGWLKIGYHFVIKRDGSIEIGRDFNDIGAHARGHNSYSVGICLVGGLNDESEPENNFTEAQWGMLSILVDGLSAKYPEAKIIGHNEVADKACPSFDVQEWMNARGT